MITLRADAYAALGTVLAAIVGYVAVWVLTDPSIRSAPARLEALAFCRYLARSMGRRLPDLPPLAPLPRDSQPVSEFPVTITARGEPEALADDIEYAVRAAYGMPQRPGRMPPGDELPWACAASITAPDARYDPCGRGPVASASSKSGGTT